MRVIDRLEDQETDPDRKGRFRQLREALSDAGKDVLARTLAELLKSMAGGIG
jgi:DNA-binding HxlR family transcriptional regulator